MNQEEEERQLYLIMTDKKYRYCLYRIGEPQVTSGEDEATIRDLEKPLLEMDGSIFPQLMGFAAIGSRLFMVGGLAYDEEKKIYRASKKVFIYDTESSTLVSGPKLKSRKANPHLITLSSKIFVFSDLIYSGDRTSLDRKPRFEMLDTNDFERGWSPLPLPTLYVATTTKETVFTVDALAAVDVSGGTCSGGIIILSISDAGTYVFDVDKRVWDYVTDEMLPFEGTAMSLPHDSSMCCAYSLKSRRFSAFRFWYGVDESNKSGFQVEEIQIDNTDSLSPPMPPEICYRPRITIPGPHGMMYFVDSGVDAPDATYTLIGNRYVKVSAMQLSNLNHNFNNKGPSLKRCGMKNLNKGQSLIRCTNKERKMGHDEEHYGTLKVGVNKAESSKRGKKMRQMGHVEEGEETKELTLTRIWRMCYFGGEVCDPLIHVAAAFVM